MSGEQYSEASVHELDFPNHDVFVDSEGWHCNTCDRQVEPTKGTDKFKPVAQILDENRMAFYNGIRSRSDVNWFTKLVGKIRAETLDVVAAEIEGKVKGWKMPPHQVFAEMRRRARELSP